MPASTSKHGWRAPDGVNIWGALLAGTASPRTGSCSCSLRSTGHRTSARARVCDDQVCAYAEVVHQVVSPYFHEACSSMQMGEMKIIVGNPGDARTIGWPEPDRTKATPFGLTGGVVEPGTDHARASGISTKPDWPRDCFMTQCKIAHFDLGGHSGARKARSAAECQAQCAAHNVAARTDPAVNGCDAFVWIADDGRCGLKGGHGGAPSPQAGAAGGVNHSVCGFANNATCVPKAPVLPCKPFCLFNLTSDLGEKHAGLAHVMCGRGSHQRPTPNPARD